MYRRFCSFALLSFAGILPASAQQRAMSITAARDIVVDSAGRSLSKLGWLGVSGTGAVVLAQPVDHRIRVFSPDGNDAGRVGNSSEGAGGFATITAAGWRGDTLWVHDAALRRITLISPALKVVRTIQLTFQVTGPNGEVVDFPTFSGPPSVPVSGLYSDGSYLVNARLSPTFKAPEQWRRTDTADQVFLHVAVNGLVRGVVTWVPANRACTNLLPLCSRSLFAVAADGTEIVLVSAATAGPDSGAVSVRVIGSNGDTVLSRRFPFVAIAVSKDYADSVAEGFARRRAAIPANVWLPPTGNFEPSIYPPFLSVILGADHSIWLEKRRAGSGREWLVLDSRGVERGTVEFPLSFRLLAADANQAWGGERLGKGGENLVRYKLARP